MFHKIQSSDFYCRVGLVVSGLLNVIVGCVYEQNDAVFRFVELRIHSNHGQPLFTCLYRFRVHGRRPRQ